MQHMPDRPERLGLDRIDQRTHPRMEFLGARHALRRTRAALGGVLGRPPLGDIDDLASEQRLFRAFHPLLFRQRRIGVDHRCRQVGFGEIEADPAFLDRQAGYPVRLPREQVRQGRFLICCRGAQPLLKVLHHGLHHLSRSPMSTSESSSTQSL